MARVRLTRVMLVAGAIEAVGLLANAAITYFSTNTTNSLLRWILPALVALGVAMAQAGADTQDGDRAGRPPRRAGHRGTPAAVAILVVLLVVGAGGLAVAAGVRYAVGWVTGKEEMLHERLATAPVSGSAGPITADVVALTETRHFTRAMVELTNAAEFPASVPLYRNCILTAPGINPLQADAFRSPWADQLAGHATRQPGTIVFSGHLPDDAPVATLSCAHVLVFGPAQAGSLTVELPLRAP